MVADGEVSKEAFETAGTLRSEFVVGIKGTVVMRKADAVNPKLKTGRWRLSQRPLRYLAGLRPRQYI